MKRLIMALMSMAGVVLVTATAHAANCQVGVTGGVAIQKLGGSDVDGDPGNRTGFVGGLYAQDDFSKNFGLRLEGLYFMKGASTDTLNVTGTLKLDYIEFPVLAMAHVPLSATAQLSFFGGPTFGFNTSAKAEVSGGGLSGSVDIGDQVKTFEFGLTFGAGLSFDMGSVILGVDGRYGFGLSKIPDLSSGDVNSGDDVKNKGFAVMASVGIPVGSKQ